MTAPKKPAAKKAAAKKAETSSSSVSPGLGIQDKFK